MNNFETATAKIIDNVPFCSFCNLKMVLGHEEITPDGYKIQAFICEQCFCSYIQGDPRDRFLQFYERIAQHFYHIWRTSLK